MQFNSSHAKYLTQNPINKYIVANFFKEVKVITTGLEYNTILDVGCGEGNLLLFLKSNNDNRTYYAIDNDEKELNLAKINIPFCNLSVGSIYALPFSDDSKDLVICTEVLEHIECPEKAIEELHRVTSRYVIISVPREPLWRILNMLRFHYWNELGNTPGHVNHWSNNSFIRLMSQWFNILEVRSPYPWTLLLCEK